MLLGVTCPVCGGPEGAPCPRCAAHLRRRAALPAIPGINRCAAFIDYEGAGRELVARFKYRNARASLRFLAAGMAGHVDSNSVDAVTWAPTNAGRRRRRGYDQAAILARAVARRLGLPCRRLLARHPGPPQTGLDRPSRHRGPSFTARLRPPGRVLIVDDVITTGGTLAAAARALRNAGALEVHAVAAAYTPPRGRASDRPRNQA